MPWSVFLFNIFQGTLWKPNEPQKHWINQPTNQPTTWSIPYPSPTNQPTPSLKARLLETFFDQTSFNFTIAQILQNQWKLALLMRKPRKSPPKWTNCDPFFFGGPVRKNWFEWMKKESVGSLFGVIWNFLVIFCWGWSSFGLNMAHMEPWKLQFIGEIRFKPGKCYP